VPIKVEQINAGPHIPIARETQRITMTTGTDYGDHVHANTIARETQRIRALYCLRRPLLRHSNQQVYPFTKLSK